MTRKTLSLLNAEFAEFPITRAIEQPTEHEISQAERQVGVPFSDAYRQFLSRYGGGVVGPHPIYGLRKAEVMDERRWSVVDVTNNHRSKGTPGTDQWAVISNDHGGNPVGMDRDGKIWIHDHDFGGISPLADSFEDYIRKICLKA
jgi:hypothetical protein